MQLVTMTYKGVTYDLGYILPVWVDIKQQFVIIPTFEFRPPFVLLRMERCHLRMSEQALQHLKDGKTIPHFRRAKPLAIEPLHNIIV
jgi:hypothetical protein